MSGDWYFLVALNEKLRALRDPVEIQSAAIQLIGEHLQASRVHYAQIQDNEFVIQRSYAVAAAAPFPDRGLVARFGKAVVDACRRNDYVDGVPSMTGRFPWADLVGSRNEEILSLGRRPILRRRPGDLDHRADRRDIGTRQRPWVP
ncbi:MAG TPA: hypothetical protein VFU28_26615 [Vicinamibacterales bacterium]|nr:hypothetical protein [Vicinamibacterales bacterium]